MSAQDDLVGVAVPMPDVLLDPTEGSQDLLANLRDPNPRRQVIVDQDGRVAKFGHAMRHISVLGFVERSEVPAVNEDKDRRGGDGRGKNVELLPRTVAVGDVQAVVQGDARNLALERIQPQMKTAQRMPSPEIELMV